MIPEQREQLEQRDMQCEKKEILRNRLQAYLRKEFSYESLQNPEIKVAAIKGAVNVAKDFAWRHGLQMNDTQAYRLGKYAVGNFLENWQGKEEGVDDRSHCTQKFIAQLSNIY